MTLPISVFIITKNEQRHLAKTLESVKTVAEVIIVDSGSTDNTLAIAEQYGAKVFHKAWEGYAIQKQYAMSLCKNEWVLSLDGDETVNPQLLNALQLTIESDNADCVRMWRNDIFIGKSLSHLSKKPNNHRFYKKSKAFFNSEKLVHESATITGKEIFINETFDHYGYDSIEAITSKNNKYSSLKADEKFSNGKSFSTFKLITIFPFTFFKEYLLQRKIFSGKRGLILSIMEAYYSFIKEAKLYENSECSQNSKNVN
ncbi:glycosyltransferase family 2 protein [Shewanella donghaensis]|uniref:glycosyltransferase family 2 protein n=1 Tax=Shewanella donghaensis TaxID=238836 RepID=UPI001183F66D|nr:glycosyltransferase family 2 protein [Shewanella donghaensis]